MPPSIGLIIVATGENNIMSHLPIVVQVNVLLWELKKSIIQKEAENDFQKNKKKKEVPFRQKQWIKSWKYFSVGLDGKYFRFYMLKSLCLSYSTLPLQCKSSHKQYISKLCSKSNFISENRWLAEFGLLAVAFSPCDGSS